MANKQRWAPWPEKKHAARYEVSSSGQVRRVGFSIRDSNGVTRHYPQRPLTVTPECVVGLPGGSRSVPKAVMEAFGKLPAKWR